MAIGNQQKDQDYFRQNEKKVLLDAITELEDRGQDTRQELLKNSDADHWMRVIGVLLMIIFCLTLTFLKISKLVDFLKRKLSGATPQQPPEVPIELIRQGRTLPKITY